MTGDIKPGLLVLYANRTETMAVPLFGWLRTRIAGRMAAQGAT